MERSSRATQPPAGQEPSTGELVRQLSEQVSVLVHDELKLARLEMTRKGKQAGLGVGMLGAGGLTALYVGVVLLAVSAAAALLGKGRLQKAIPPVPDQAVGSLKADVEEIKQRAHPYDDSGTGRKAGGTAPARVSGI
jgi:hypothetical protein